MACRCGYKIISRNLNDNINHLFSPKNASAPVQQNSNVTNHISSVYITKCNYSDNVQLQNSEEEDKLKIKSKGLIKENASNTANYRIDKVKEMNLVPVRIKIDKDENINKWAMNKVAGRPMTPNISNAIMIRSSLPYISQMNTSIIKANNKELANKLLNMERPVSDNNLVLDSKPATIPENSTKTNQFNTESALNTNSNNIFKKPKMHQSAHNWNNINSSKQILSYNKFKISKNNENQYKPSKSVYKIISSPEKGANEKKKNTDVQETKPTKCTKIDNKILIKDEKVASTVSNPKPQYKLIPKIAAELSQKNVIQKKFNNVNKEQEYIHRNLLNINQLTKQEAEPIKNVEEKHKELGTIPNNHIEDKNVEISLNNSNQKINKIMKKNLQHNFLVPNIVKRISTDHKVEKVITFVPPPNLKTAAKGSPSQHKVYKPLQIAKQNNIKAHQKNDFLKKRINQQSKNSLNQNPLSSISNYSIKVKEKKEKSCKVSKDPTILIKKPSPLKSTKVMQLRQRQNLRKNLILMSEKRNTLKPVQSSLNIPGTKQKKVTSIRKDSKQNKVIATTYVSKLKMIDQHNRVNNLKFNAKLKLNTDPAYKLSEVESTICINDDLMPFKKLKFNSDIPITTNLNEKRLIKKGEYSSSKLNLLTEKLVPKRNNFLKSSQYHFKASNYSPKIVFKTFIPSYLSEATKTLLPRHTINRYEHNFPVQKNLNKEPPKKPNNKKLSGLFEKIYFK